MCGAEVSISSTPTHSVYHVNPLQLCLWVARTAPFIGPIVLSLRFSSPCPPSHVVSTVHQAQCDGGKTQSSALSLFSIISPCPILHFHLPRRQSRCSLPRSDLQFLAKVNYLDWTWSSGFLGEDDLWYFLIEHKIHKTFHTYSTSVDVAAEVPGRILILLHQHRFLFVC